MYMRLFWNLTRSEAFRYSTNLANPQEFREPFRIPRCDCGLWKNIDKTYASGWGTNGTPQLKIAEQSLMSANAQCSKSIRALIKNAWFRLVTSSISLLVWHDVAGGNWWNSGRMDEFERIGRARIVELDKNRMCYVRARWKWHHECRLLPGWMSIWCSEQFSVKM